VSGLCQAGWPEASFWVELMALARSRATSSRCSPFVVRRLIVVAVVIVKSAAPVWQASRRFGVCGVLFSAIQGQRLCLISALISFHARDRLSSSRAPSSSALMDWQAHGSAHLGAYCAQFTFRSLYINEGQCVETLGRFIWTTTVSDRPTLGACFRFFALYFAVYFHPHLHHPKILPLNQNQTASTSRLVCAPSERPTVLRSTSCATKTARSSPMPSVQPPKWCPPDETEDELRGALYCL